MVLGWHKKDFDITAAVAAAIALAVTSAAVSGIAFSQSVVTASMVDKLSDEVATALNIQNNINAMIQLGILNLNQQIFRINETRVSPWAGDQIFQGLQLAGAAHQGMEQHLNPGSFDSGNWRIYFIPPMPVLQAAGPRLTAEATGYSVSRYSQSHITVMIKHSK